MKAKIDWNEPRDVLLIGGKHDGRWVRVKDSLVMSITVPDPATQMTIDDDMHAEVVLNYSEYEIDIFRGEDVVLFLGRPPEQTMDATIKQLLAHYQGGQYRSERS